MPPLPQAALGHNAETLQNMISSMTSQISFTYQEGNACLTLNQFSRTPSFPFISSGCEAFLWTLVGIFNLLKKGVWAKPSGGRTLPFRNATEGFFLVGLMMPGGDFGDLWDVIFMSWLHTQQPTAPLPHIRSQRACGFWSHLVDVGNKGRRKCRYN